MGRSTVKWKRELEIARQVCREWELLDPAEVARWRKCQQFLAEHHEWNGGWTKSKAHLAMEDAPSYVVFRMARGLMNIGWHPEAARLWDRQLDGNKWGPSELWKLVVRELLPEAKTSRKERRLRSFSGVELPAS